MSGGPVYAWPAGSSGPVVARHCTAVAAPGETVCVLAWVVLAAPGAQQGAAWQGSWGGLMSRPFLRPGRYLWLVPLTLAAKDES